MIRKTSAGIVVFRRERSRVLFLLLHYPAGHWDFVKGKMEEGESMHQTALREAEEETGITDIEFVEGFEERIRYRFQHKGRVINKKVVFFLGETGTGDVALSHEHVGHAWLDYRAAMGRLTFEKARGVLSKSRARLREAL